jgi:hypothetical protein
MSQSREIGTDRYTAIQVALSLRQLAPEAMLSQAIEFVDTLDCGRLATASASDARGLVEQGRKVIRHSEALVEGNAVAIDETILRHGPGVEEHSAAVAKVALLLNRQVVEHNLPGLRTVDRYKTNPGRLGHVGLRAIGLGVTTLGSLDRAATRSGESKEKLKEMLTSLGYAVRRAVPEAGSEPRRGVQNSNKGYVHYGYY